nr:Chain A, Leiurotoxin [synthetic construct]
AFCNLRMCQLSCRKSLGCLLGKCIGDKCKCYGC